MINRAKFLARLPQWPPVKISDKLKERLVLLLVLGVVVAFILFRLGPPTTNLFGGIEFIDYEMLPDSIN